MDRRLTLGGGLAAVAVLAANAAPNFDTTVDDAWISARYALHLAEGHGLVYNIGEPAIEGYSNLLWTCWIGLGLALGLPPSAWMTTTGLGFAAIALFAALGWARSLAGRDDPVLWAVPLSLALSPHLAVATTNGLETGMWLAAIAGAGWAVHATEGAGTRALAGLLAGGLAAVRPEGLALCGLLVLADAWRRRERWRDPTAWTLAGTALLAVLGLLAWRASVYGAWLPNTFDAKANLGVAKLLEANGRYLGRDGGVWPAVGALLLLAPALSPRRVAWWVPSLIGIACWAAAAQVIMWMPGARLMLPGQLAAAVGVVAMATTRTGWWRAGLAALPVLVSLGALLSPVGRGTRAYDRRNTVVPDNPARRAAEHLGRHAPGTRMAIRDAGVVAFWVGTGVRVAETHQRALTQPHPGGAHLDLDRLLAPGPPELAVTTVQRLEHTRSPYGNDRFVLARGGGAYRWLGRVEQHYHRYYDVWVLDGTDVPALPASLLAPYDGRPPR